MEWGENTQGKIHQVKNTRDNTLSKNTRENTLQYTHMRVLYVDFTAPRPPCRAISSHQRSRESGCRVPLRGERERECRRPRECDCRRPRSASQRGQCITKLVSSKSLTTAATSWSTHTRMHQSIAHAEPLSRGRFHFVYST